MNVKMKENEYEYDLGHLPTRMKELQKTSTYTLSYIALQVCKKHGM